MSVNEPSAWEKAVEKFRQDPACAEFVKDNYFDHSIVEAATRYYHSEEWRRIRELISSQKGRVLDIGAGNGITSYAFAKDGWTVDAIEPDPGEIVGYKAIEKLAASTGVNIDVKTSFGESLPFDDASFDLVFARQVLHHANDLDLFCKEAYRVLKKGGSFLTIRDHVASTRGQKRRFLAKHPLQKYYGGENAFSVREYTSAITGAGFVVEKMLRHFESPINRYPLDAQRLIDKLNDKIGFTIPFIGTTTGRETIIPWLFAALDKVDFRAGRLYSFLSKK